MSMQCFPMSLVSGAASQDNDIYLYDQYLSDPFGEDPLENIPYPDGLFQEPTDQTTDTRASNVSMTPQRLTCLPMCHHVHSHDEISSPTQESQVEDAKKKIYKKLPTVLMMTNEECNAFTLSLRNVRENDSTFLHCFCHAGLGSSSNYTRGSCCKNFKPFVTKQGVSISTPKTTIIETTKKLIHDKSKLKGPSQQDYPKELIPLICPPGSCKHFHSALKHFLAYLQLYGGSRFDPNVRAKPIRHAEIIKAKHILLLFAKDVNFWIDWTRNLTPGFREPLGGCKTMRDATKEFFSEDE